MSRCSAWRWRGREEPGGGRGSQFSSGCCILDPPMQTQTLRQALREEFTPAGRESCPPASAAQAVCFCVSRESPPGGGVGQSGAALWGRRRRGQDSRQEKLGLEGTMQRGREMGARETLRSSWVRQKPVPVLGFSGFSLPSSSGTVGKGDRGAALSRLQRRHQGALVRPPALLG